MWPRPQDHLLYVFTGACSGSCCFGDNVFYLLPMGAYLPYTFWYICILHLGHLSLKQNFVHSIIWDNSLSFTHLGQHSLQPVTRDYIAKGENKIVHRNKQLNASILEHFFPTCQVRVSKLVFFSFLLLPAYFFFSLLFLVFFLCHLLGIVGSNHSASSGCSGPRLDPKVECQIRKNGRKNVGKYVRYSIRQNPRLNVRTCVR